WQSSSHADFQRKRHILDRVEDPSGHFVYAVNETHLRVLIVAEFGDTRAPQRKEAGSVVRDAPVELSGELGGLRPSVGELRAHLVNARTFVDVLFAGGERASRVPNSVDLCEKAWSELGGRGQRDKLREAASRKIEAMRGAPVGRGRPKKSPK